jgi:hypothetical protein
MGCCSLYEAYGPEGYGNLVLPPCQECGGGFESDHTDAHPHFCHGGSEHPYPSYSPMLTGLLTFLQGERAKAVEELRVIEAALRE